MRDLVIKTLAGVLRASLGGLSTYLISNGIVDEGGVAQLLTGLATAAVTIGWTAWDKIVTARVTNTALATSTGNGATVREIEKAVAAGVFAPATTSKDVAPVISVGTGDDGASTGQ